MNDHNWVSKKSSWNGNQQRMKEIYLKILEERKHNYKHPYDPPLRMTYKYYHQGTIQQFIKPQINKYPTNNQLHNKEHHCQQ